MHARQTAYQKQTLSQTSKQANQTCSPATGEDEADCLGYRVSSWPLRASSLKRTTLVTSPAVSTESFPALDTSFNFFLFVWGLIQSILSVHGGLVLGTGSC